MLNGIDEQLIKRVADGNCRALETIIQKYKGKAYSWALRFSDNALDHDEIVNNVWITLWRKAHQFRCDSQFSTWFYTICRTECLMWIRKQKAKEETHFDISEYEFPAVESLISRFYHNQVLQVVQQSIDSMKPEWATEVLDIVTHDIKGHGTPTAKSRRKRGRDNLISFIQRTLEEDLKEVVNF